MVYYTGGGLWTTIPGMAFQVIWGFNPSFFWPTKKLGGEPKKKQEKKHANKMASPPLTMHSIVACRHFIFSMLTPWLFSSPLCFVLQECMSSNSTIYVSSGFLISYIMVFQTISHATQTVLFELLPPVEKGWTCEPHVWKNWPWEFRVHVFWWKK